MIDVDPELNHADKVTCFHACTQCCTALRRSGASARSQRVDATLVQVLLDVKRLLDEPVPPILLPAGEVFLQPLPRRALPTNVPAQLLAFDPLVLLNFLLLGPKNISQRILFSVS